MPHPSLISLEPLFTGAWINYKKELELAFGDYIEVYDGMEDTSRSRNIPCIAMYPCCNAMGSWNFMSLKSKTKVHRSQWQLMVTIEAAIDAMNAFDEEPVAIVAEPAVNVGTAAPNTTVMEQITEVPVSVLVDKDTG